MRILFLGPVFLTITCPVEGIEPSKHPQVFSILCYVYVLSTVDHLSVMLNNLRLDHLLLQTVCKDAANKSLTMAYKQKQQDKQLSGRQPKLFRNRSHRDNFCEGIETLPAVFDKTAFVKFKVSYNFK
jgi:hypothetical protein